jgi:hypothetical protein
MKHGAEDDGSKFLRHVANCRSISVLHFVIFNYQFPAAPASLSATEMPDVLSQTDDRAIPA